MLSGVQFLINIYIYIYIYISPPRVERSLNLFNSIQEVYIYIENTNEDETRC